MLNLKQKIIAIIAVIGAILIFIFQRGIYNNPAKIQSSTPQAEKTQNLANEDPKVVATNPSPLEEATILPNQTLEITFNLPIENPDEFKNRIDPQTDHKIELSSDRKTAKVIFSKPLELGRGYTLFVKPDTKFDGAKNLNQDLIFHFRTIDYQGV
ncbi:MAG: hypothetical protein M1142_03670 [Patescibacteria group bacterium]|nr:hypothetical protein [Patescibacteria group bacterium]